MKSEYESLPLVNNTAGHRFELTTGGHVAFIEYRQDENVVSLIHTKVPPELEGKGVGNAIIKKTLTYIEQNHFRLIPLCPFVRAFLKRHPEWNRLVDTA
jgi:predicted GNAT family acetyltransferase